jgi:hypothetical protein
MDNLQAIAVIIGVVNGVRLFKEGNDVTPKNYWGFALFLISLILGVGFGFAHMFGLTVESGIVVALASSGLYRVGEKVGGN